VNRKTFFSGAVVVCVVGLVLAGCADPTATESSPDRAVAELTTSPDPAAAEAEANESGSALSPTFEELAAIPGFESGGLSEGTNDLEIYWHGPLPDAALASIARAEARGQQVTIVEVPYSYAEIWEISTRLVAALGDADIDVWAFGPNRRNDKIELSGPELSVEPGLQERALAIAAEIVPDDVKIVFTPNDSDFVTYDSRHFDSGAPTVGDQLNGTGKCTGGLGMTRPGVGEYFLTAAHCFGYANGVSSSIPGNSATGSSTFIPTLLGSPNTASSSQFQVDAGFVSYVPSGASVDAQMFYGANNASSKVDVDATGIIPWDTTLCSSGAATGLNCNFERTTNQTRECIRKTTSGSCNLWADVVKVDSTNDAIMFGSGDSGGPIYYLTGGQRKVVAFVEGGDGAGTVPCGATNYYYDPSNPEYSICSTFGGRITALWTIQQELTDAGYTFTANTQ
jgi:hypothetical protein